MCTCWVATGVNADGHRETLGVEVVSAEDGAGWVAFLRGLVARGLTGVQLVVSDAHAGLVEAIAATLPGAGWQRCRTHQLRNLVPKSTQPWVATLVRTIFDQPAAEEVAAQHARVVGSLEAKHPDAAEHLEQARPDLPAFTAFPRQLWRQIWSNNPQERLNKEIRHRTDVVGSFPDRAAITRLVGAVLMEQTDEWTEARRYMGLEFLPKSACASSTAPHPTPRSTSKNLPLNLQKQDHAETNSYTTPLDVTVAYQGLSVQFQDTTSIGGHRGIRIPPA